MAVLQIVFLRAQHRNPESYEQVRQLILAAGGYNVFNHCNVAVAFEADQPIWIPKLGQPVAVPSQVLACRQQGEQFTFADWQIQAMSFEAQQILRICNQELRANAT
jgi:hypothetical protein